MGYTGDCREVWFWSLICLLCITYVASSPVYDRWPDLTRRMPQKMDPPGCAYKGQKFQHGEQVETPEPCLNCTCIRAVLVCYLRVCPTAVAPPAGCFPAREPGHCCPTLVCGINDLIPQTSEDEKSDIGDDTTTIQENVLDLRPTFKPSTTLEHDVITTDGVVKISEILTTKENSQQSVEYKGTSRGEYVSSIPTAVPKYQTMIGSTLTSNSGADTYQTGEFNNHQRITTSYAEPEDRLTSHLSSTELDTSVSKEPSTTWFTVPDAIARITITVQDAPSSSESSDVSKHFINLDKSTESKELYSQTLLTSAEPTKLGDHDTENADSLLFVTSTMASPHDHFSDYDLSFLNDIPGGCLLNGTLYGDGSAMLSSSFCEYCFCIRGKQTCLKPKCHIEIEGCTAKYDSEYICCPSRYDCSEREKPFETSLLEPTSSEPPMTTEQLIREGLCQVGDKEYAVGNVIPNYQVCHNCYCNYSNVVCHKISCSPPVDGCKPIIPIGKCCPISYRCDIVQGDSAAMDLESSNDIPPPNKLEAEMKETTAEKITSQTPSSSYGIKTNYAHKVKGHQRPVAAQSVSHRIKTSNRKPPIYHRLKYPLIPGGQKTSGIKNIISIQRRVDESNSTQFYTDDFETPDFDDDGEGDVGKQPGMQQFSSIIPVSIGNIYTESILRQSRHDTTIGGSTREGYGNDPSVSDTTFVTKSIENNLPVTSSRGNDKTLDLDNFDIGSLLISTMRAISSISDFQPNSTISEPMTTTQHATDEKITSSGSYSTVHQEEPMIGSSSTGLPEVQTISLEELFKKFIKTAINTTAIGPAYQGNKNSSSNFFRNNSKQPSNIDDIQLLDAPSNDATSSNDTSSNLTSVTIIKDSLNDLFGHSSVEISHTFTPTASQFDEEKESNQPISKDPLLSFETRPIFLELTSEVPEPVYLLTTEKSTSNASITLEKGDNLPDNQRNLSSVKDSDPSSKHSIDEILADQPTSRLDNKTTTMELKDTKSSTNTPVGDEKTDKSNIEDDANEPKTIDSENRRTTKDPLPITPITTEKPDSTAKTGGMWTLVSSSTSPIIQMSTKIDETTAAENSGLKFDSSSVKHSITTSIIAETSATTPAPLASRINSKLPVKILIASHDNENDKTNKTHPHIAPYTTSKLMSTSTQTVIIAHDRNYSSPAVSYAVSVTQIPNVVTKTNSKVLPDRHDHSEDMLDDDNADIDNDYGYFSDDSLDDLDFLSKSHNEDVFEFLSGFTKTESHSSEATTAQPALVETTPSLENFDHTTSLESIGTVRISAPISVIDPNSTHNQSLLQDILESKSKVRTTESGGVIYMDPKYTDIKIEVPDPGRNENVSVVPHATEVFELSEETSAQTGTESPVDRADTHLSQNEKKKEARIEDIPSQIDMDNKQGNPNFKVIPFVVADALRGGQNRTQTMLVSQDEYLTTEDVVTDFCFISGRLYVNGEMIVKADPCELCRCFYGKELCQLQRCPAPPAPDCVPEYLQGFCCPRLTCGKNGAPENPGAEQISVPLKRHHAVRPSVVQLKPGISQATPGRPINPHIGLTRPANLSPNQIKPNDQPKPTVIIQRPPFRQGTPYRPPQSQQQDRFQLNGQNHKQVNEVRPNLQLNLPASPSRTNIKDEVVVTQAPTAPPLKYGLRVRPPTTTTGSALPQESVKWTTTSTRVTRSTTSLSRTPSTFHVTESSTPPFRRQTTSRRSPTTSKITVATTSSKMTEKPTTSTTSTLPTTAYEAAKNAFMDPWGLLKVSGCNIYGKFYNVNERVEVLSGPCSHCICAANGVECNDIC